MAAPNPPKPHAVDERLIRYLRDGDGQAIDHIIKAYWPTVMSVCRRYHSDTHEAEDAAQETFLRLLRHAPNIRSHLGAWLKTTARSVCVDHIRKAVRQRDRIEDLAQTPAADASAASRHRVQAKLTQAIDEIDPAMRELLTERFWNLTPLRVLAGKKSQSISMVYRQLQKGIAQTAEVLKDMGIDELDDLTRRQLVDQITHETLHQATHWPQPYGKEDGEPQLTFPGWNRPIRVGTLVSHYAQTTSLNDEKPGFLPQEDESAFMMRFVTDPRFELVSIIDPGTDDVGMVERVIRDYEFYDGLIYGNDLESLKTLDVIVVGLCFGLREDVLHTLRLAVDGGVGFFNDGWLGKARLGTQHPDVMALSLDAKPSHHECPALKHLGRPCGDWEGKATAGQIEVLTEHPATPSWTAGQTFLSDGCSPTIVPTPGSVVVAERALTIPGTEGCRAPFLVAGNCGRGRVVYLQTIWGFKHVPQWTEDLSWVSDALRWLAEPRRELPG
ncbi:MAG: sigma-70 family RNA polymerase sigma factor [Planctomycetota bacterium]